MRRRPVSKDQHRVKTASKLSSGFAWLIEKYSTPCEKHCSNVTVCCDFWAFNALEGDRVLPHLKFSISFVTNMLHFYQELVAIWTQGPKCEVPWLACDQCDFALCEAGVRGDFADRGVVASVLWDSIHCTAASCDEGYWHLPFTFGLWNLLVQFGFSCSCCWSNSAVLRRAWEWFKLAKVILFDFISKYFQQKRRLAHNSPELPLKAKTGKNARASISDFIFWMHSSEKPITSGPPNHTTISWKTFQSSFLLVGELTWHFSAAIRQHCDPPASNALHLPLLEFQPRETVRWTNWKAGARHFSSHLSVGSRLAIARPSKKAVFGSQTSALSRRRCPRPVNQLGHGFLGFCQQVGLHTTLVFCSSYKSRAKPPEICGDSKQKLFDLIGEGLHDGWTFLFSCHAWI